MFIPFISPLLIAEFIQTLQPLLLLIDTLCVPSVSLAISALAIATAATAIARLSSVRPGLLIWVAPGRVPIVRPLSIAVVSLRRRSSVTSVTSSALITFLSALFTTLFTTLLTLFSALFSVLVMVTMMLHLLQIDLTAKNKTKQNEILSPKQKMKSFRKGGEIKTTQNSTLLQIFQNFTNPNISQTTQQKQEYTTYLTQLSSRETVHLGVCIEEPDSESTNYLKTTNFRNFFNYYPMLSFLQNLDDEIPGLRVCYLREIS
jgi:hypothetical protein